MFTVIDRQEKFGGEDVEHEQEKFACHRKILKLGWEVLWACRYFQTTLHWAERLAHRSLLVMINGIESSYVHRMYYKWSLICCKAKRWMPRSSEVGCCCGQGCVCRFKKWKLREHIRM
jgi:hypothetical protein